MKTTEAQATYRTRAIETVYKGYRFRSRLEARWAVFLDALEIEWEYEKEGYELPLGRYLPDFWLPRLECFAEVKQKLFTTEEYQKCVQLPFPCLLLDVEHPTGQPYYVAGLSEEFAPYSQHMKDGYGWVILSQSTYKGRLWLLFGENYSDYDGAKDEFIAENAAKAARFEFGDKVLA